MIGKIKGVLSEIVKRRLLIEVQSSLSYEVYVTDFTLKELPAIDSEVTLHTHLLVTDSSHTLYGFRTRYERDVFRGLLSINGIGSSRAITSLSQMSAEDLVEAINERNVDKITTLQGIGAAKAELIIKKFPEIAE